MKPDLDKAREIVRAYRSAGKSIIGVGGSLDERVAALVAKGIALGRKEALEAVKAAKSNDA